MEMTKVIPRQLANTQENNRAKGKMEAGEFAGILKSIDTKAEKHKSLTEEEGQAKEKTLDLLAYMFVGQANLPLGKTPDLEGNIMGLQNFSGAVNGELESKILGVSMQKVMPKEVGLLGETHKGVVKEILEGISRETPKETPKEMLKEVIKDTSGGIKNPLASEGEKTGKLLEISNQGKASKDSEPKILSLEYREINYPQKAEGEKTGKMMIISKSQEVQTEESVKANSKVVETNIGKSDQAPLLGLEKAETPFKVQGETPSIRNTQDNATKVQEAIIKLFETTTEGQTSKMRVSLHPESLGKVDIGLTMEGGKLTASIQVESNQIKELFANKVGELNQSLAKQGLVIERIHIEVKAQAENLAMNMNQQGNFNQQGKRQWTSKTNNIFKEDFNNIKDIESISLEKGVSVLA